MVIQHYKSTKKLMWLALHTNIILILLANEPPCNVWQNKYWLIDYHVAFWQFLHEIELSCNILTSLMWYQIIMYFDLFYMKLNYHVIFWPFFHDIKLSCNILTILTWNWIIVYFNHFLHEIELSCNILTIITWNWIIM